MECTTCHVIIDPDWWNRIEPPKEEEMDMLDIAMGVEDTSRLSCQVKIDEKMAGMKVKVPPT